MKTKTAKSNALFGLLVAVFATCFFSMLPSPEVQAGDPPTQPGLSYSKLPPAADAADSTAALPAADTSTPPPLVVDGDPPAFVPDPVGEIITGMLDKWTLYVAGIVNLLVLLTGAFPKLTFFADDRKRDLLAKTLGAVLVAGLTVFTLGPAQIWPVLSGFALAVFAYKNVIKVVARTKTSAPPKVVA